MCRAGAALMPPETLLPAGAEGQARIVPATPPWGTPTACALTKLILENDSDKL